MKILFTILFLILISFNVMAQDDTTSSSEPEFEMKQYYFVFLNSAPDRPTLDSADAMEVQKGHLDNITKMWNEGKCKLAGPFMDKNVMRGILILDVPTLEEAEALMQNDPAVIRGLLQPVIRPWYGPAGLTVNPK